jgi:hypothetical protein
VITIGSRQSRKVTASGVIWVQGHAYYVSRRLAGHVIPVEIEDGRLTIEVTIPLRKVYRLPKGPAPKNPPPENGALPHNLHSATG